MVAAAVVACALFAAVSPGYAAPLDGREWEMVSPLEKNGGGVGFAGTPEAGVLLAAAGGDGITYGSAASFGDAAGAAPVSQYVARRSALGWTTENLTPPLLSGTYDGDPYLGLADDLSRALLSNGWSCRDGGETCEAENPPLAPNAAAGYRNLYLREGGGYTALLTPADGSVLNVGPEEFKLSLAGASPDLGTVVLRANGGLFEWHQGQVELISADAGADLAAPAGAVSEGGSRIYWTEGERLYLREGAETVQVAEGADFAAASRDGSRAFLVEAEELYRYNAVSRDLEGPIATGVTAVAGASPDGSVLFLVMGNGLYRWQGGSATKLISASPSQLPPATGSAAVSAGGGRFFFTSPNALLSADTNGDLDAYEWEAGGFGSCGSSPGCLGLLSRGRGGRAAFAAASASGDDAFFTTDAGLVNADLGSVDLYDARVGGGFPAAPATIPCEGDACQGPPPKIEDPTPGTASFKGPANPSLKQPKPRRRHHRAKRHRHKHHRHHHRGAGR